MKYISPTLLFAFLSMFAKAQERQPAAGATFRYMNIWSNVSGSAISPNIRPKVDIDSASGAITIRIPGPEVAETLRIYDLTGTVLFERPLEPGNNVITLTGLSRKVFIFCVEHNGLSQYSMQIARI